MDLDSYIAKWQARDDLGSSESAFNSFLKRHGIRVYRVGGGEVIRRNEWLAAVRHDLKNAEQSEQAL
jgi:hypothetical protein